MVSKLGLRISLGFVLILIASIWLGPAATACTGPAPAVVVSFFPETTPSPTPDFTLSSLQIFPAQVSPGSPVTISVLLTNNSAQNGSYDIDLLINNHTVSTKTVSGLAGKNSRIVVFTSTQNAPGIYHVSLGSLNGAFTVVNQNSGPVTPLNWSFIGSLAFVCLAMIWLIFRILRRKHI